ncbi:hypothetical protein ACFQZS_14020 [Mucilaginibacter calamicampi]|uniref:Uncharacterized protein n=1 Tax=Mucilaginibacter calamicampi TaxID=1302352 RepID=A0ABW2Z1A2_9SPHI
MAYKNMSSALIIKAAYEKAQVKGTHRLAPRVGHYLFQKLEVTTVTKEIEVELVKTLWKPLADNSFVDGLTFEVITRSFYSPFATGPVHIKTSDLINRLVVVKEVTIFDNNVCVTWDVLADKPGIAKPTSLYGMNPLSYDDINRMNRRFGIDDNPNDNAPYDAPDDL